MIVRFSLYGFLKNQRYFEAFLVLALLDRGLDFFQIGLLVAVRMLAVNLFEVPSGSVADVCGRRGTLVVSMAAYLAGFLVLGAARSAPLLAASMVLLGVGDSFRSGTHKAMIFAWLAEQGREHERVQVYGYTRSWSKFGSAVSVVIGAAIVLATGEYDWVFYATAVPYVLGILNILGYPASLDVRMTRRSVTAVIGHMLATLRAVATRTSLRRLIFEAMGFDGVFAAVKDYLQPVLQAAALGITIGALGRGDLDEAQRTALLVGPIYIVLYLLAGLASRRAHLVAGRFGGEAGAARALWIAYAIVFGAIAAGGWWSISSILVAAFVTMHVLHNLWRPILIARFDDHGEQVQAAALLSIESQAQRLATMVLAPVLGLAVDVAAGQGEGGTFWPIGVVGAVIAAGFAATALRRGPRPPASLESG